MATIMIIGLLLIGLVVITALWFIGGYNSLVRLKAMVDEAWSGIDVQLKRRYDLIPNLVAVVKQYATHEKEIFEKVAQARSASINATGVEQKAEAEKGLTGALRTLFAVAENYPTLKANENFMSLQKDLNLLEHDIQLSRRYYNGTARNYNVATATFPSALIASMMGFGKVSYFELGSEMSEKIPK